MPPSNSYPFRTLFNAGRIVRHGKRIDMEVEGATFATWHPDELLTGYSWDAMCAAALCHPTGAPRDILLLGLAAGTMVRILHALLPEARITAVELDGALIDVAAQHMHLDLERIDVHVGDAYAFLKTSRKRYDVILDDVFLSGSEDVFRPEQVDHSIAGLYRKRLRDDGIVAVNLLTDPAHRTLLRHAARDLKGIFAQVISITPPRGYNTAVVAGAHIGSPERIEAHRTTFTNPGDQKLWSKLKSGPSR